MNGYLLAVDFGTSSTAAVVQDDNGSELVEVGGVARVPSMVAAMDDDSLVAGEAAVRQLAINPERVERAPKRRLGDRAVLLGDRAVSPTALVAAVLRLVADEAARRRGGAAPTELRLTHPASWASTRLEALQAAAAAAGLPKPSLLPEPVAAALHLSDARIAVGDHVAVYDLGGGTFDAAVLRRTANGFELVGPPGGHDRVGGEDLDEKLLEHVGASIRAQDPESWERLRFSDERQWRRAAATLRTEVRSAKEALSSAPHATVYVPAPVDLEVRVTREELETVVRPDLERTVDEFMATVERAGSPLLQAIYLVGGGSRMPLVGRLVADRTGLTPTTWGDPKASVALGAATAGTVASEPPTGVIPIQASPAPKPAPVTPPVSPPLTEPAALAPRHVSRKLYAGGGVAAAAILAVVAAFVLTGGSDDNKKGTPAAPELSAYSFAPGVDSTVRSARTWALDKAGTTLSDSTVLTNLSAGPITRTALEVAPKEVASTVGQIAFEPGFAVVQNDPAVRYTVTLAPGASRTLRWTAHLATPADQAKLNVLAAAQRTAERDLAPRLRSLVPASVLATAPFVPFADVRIPDPGPTATTAPKATATTAPPTLTPTFSPSALPVITPVPPRTVAPTVQANRAPTLGAISNRSSDEQAAVSVTLSGSDPDRNALTYSATGLPAGLRVSGAKITGTVSYAAANVTTDRRVAIKTKAFTVTVSVTDGKGGTAKRSFTFTVRDTHRLMPDYRDDYGDGSLGKPNISAISVASNDCSTTTTGTADGQRIWRQGVAANAVIRYGQTITYWYGNDTNNCPNHLAKGW